MSQLNLVLGIIGTGIISLISLLISVISLLISWRIFRKQKPDLEIKVLKCEHDFSISKSKIKTISFWTTFQIENSGDRGTSMHDIELTFKDDGKEYILKRKESQGRYIPTSIIKEKEIKWIPPNQTIFCDATFFEIYEANDKEKIDCTFIFYHTHNTKKITCISQRRLFVEEI